jgi:signal transduction histidine kinase
VGQWKSLELYRADGTSLFVDVQAAVLHEDPNGIRALITFHDLTKGHQLEEMKVDFIALAAHELRTPVTEIRGALDILALDAKLIPAEDAKWLVHAASSAEELNRLINNLLGVSRIEHGRVSYNIVPTDYRAYLTELSSEFQRRIENSNHTFELIIPTRLPKLALDSDAIKEVLTNLVNNAIIHTPSGTHITVKVERDGEHIKTSVQDTGKGIPKSVIPNLFTKFYRAGEMKSTTRGTGLGLYISRTIVEAHNGTMEVSSQVGKGSNFTFMLPIKSPVARATKARDNTTNITRGAHGWIKTNTIR